MRSKIFILLFLCLSILFCASSPKKIERERENSPEYQYNLGLFFLNEGNVDKAVFHLDRSDAIKPGNYLVHHALGLAYSMKVELEKSVKCFQKALQLNTKSTETRNVLGVIYQEMGFLDKAEQEFRNAISDTTYVSRELPYYNLARLHIIKEDYKTALDYVERALEFDSRMVLSHNLKGVILEKLDRWEEAIDSYELALKIAPDDVNILFNLGVAHFNNNDLEEAREIFEKIRSDVTDPEIKEKIETYLKSIR